MLHTIVDNHMPVHMFCGRLVGQHLRLGGTTLGRVTFGYDLRTPLGFSQCISETDWRVPALAERLSDFIDHMARCGECVYKPQTTLNL